MAIKLTKTEQSIYENAMFGYSVEQLSNIYEISESQIKRHLSSIYKKRGVKNRVELMAKEFMALINRIRELENE
jgi:DNA-binding CsgD family transcriptional regulator